MHLVISLSLLHALLCLDVTSYIPNISKLPSPSECDLYYVNRDTLFSYHKGSELFLQRMMSLYVASHYKNSPNDLQLMVDAPAHHLFVLLGPVDESRNHLPDIICVLQILKNEGAKSLFKGAGANTLCGAGVLAGYDKLQVIVFVKKFGSGGA
ncbi:hypothetical protein POM88_048837 [Heracleum sosnowskyi]|uniref:N-acetyltransferase domain-containing protein n=1 Tax=Heracleum sosnowskyi TaxID=360622 RepID=A0AAD8GVX9_9APIA|nr:hypothetical protein POM88_048837 [Heracleum sosnowskyi]